jgi:hypothetical protein
MEKRIIQIKTVNKKEFNEYKLVDNYVIIYLEKKDGQTYETLIDFEDLEYIKSLDLHWHISICRKRVCVQATRYLGMINKIPKYTSVFLHREIMKTNGKCVIDHKNHDGLDNRKSNLRTTGIMNNDRNRAGPNKNNTSGYRNVSFVKGKYVVQLQVNGKNKVFGKFDTVDEAGIFASIIRPNIYGEYAGKD